MVSFGKAAGVLRFEYHRPVGVRFDHNNLVPLLHPERTVDGDVQIASDGKITFVLDVENVEIIIHLTPV
jgi:hypothetical protein